MTYHPGLPGTEGFPRIHVKPEIAPVLETESISETENTGNSLSNHRVRYYREPDYLFRHKCWWFPERWNINGQRPDHLLKQTHDPQPPATCPGNQPLVCNKQPRKAACKCRKLDWYLQWQSRRLKGSFCDNPECPTFAEKLTDFLIFVLLPTWINQKNSNTYLLTNSTACPLLVSPATVSPYQQFPIRIHVKTSFLPP